MTSEERSQALIRKANLNGYNHGDSIEEAIYWYATQQYLDPSFAKAYWGSGIVYRNDNQEYENWEYNLYKLVLIEGRLEKLDYIENN